MRKERNDMEMTWKQPEDGCSYYTPEEFAQFGDVFSPVEFDSSYIRRKHLDIPYGTLPEQKLDLYLPDEGEGPWPVIFYVHGGGWSMGTKTLGAVTCVIGTLEKGYAVIAPDYRLAPVIVLPLWFFVFIVVIVRIVWNVINQKGGGCSMVLLLLEFLFHI